MTTSVLVSPAPASASTSAPPFVTPYSNIVNTTQFALTPEDVQAASDGERVGGHAVAAGARLNEHSPGRLRGRTVGHAGRGWRIRRRWRDDRLRVGAELSAVQRHRV